MQYNKQEIEVMKMVKKSLKELERKTNTAYPKFHQEIKSLLIKDNKY